MADQSQHIFVETIKERCRVCFTCVRECPATAIRIADGEAEILPERCIACGNCVKVCSQKAKQVHTDVPLVLDLLRSKEKIAAIVAPSFPAEMVNLDARALVGMLRAAGFDLVCEVAFGADLVARRYKELFEEPGSRRSIATTCPAVVQFVERYHPSLVRNLAPIVSPMVAQARVLKRIHGEDLRIVFLGPCIAKKAEAASADIADEVDIALTFQGMRQLFDLLGVEPLKAGFSDFDPPHADLGRLFPIGRGMLQAAGIEEDLASEEVVAASGRKGFVAALREFQDGAMTAKLLESLACHGCIMGPGMTTHEPQFRRRYRVGYYVRRRRAEQNDSQQYTVEDFADLDLSRGFTANDQRLMPPSPDELRSILESMGKYGPADELNCGACGYATCREHATAIYKGLAETEMCLPYTIERLNETVTELADTQEALMHSEKLASMGQLAAGIAHEVNNPLGVVLMYSNLVLDELPDDSQLRGDLAMIAEQAERCKKIVAGLLGFARQNKVMLQPTSLDVLIDRSLAATALPEGVELVVQRAASSPSCRLDIDQMIQVLINLIGNACDAMTDGGRLAIATSDDPERVVIEISDTGCGIPQDNLKKIFDPFFTTKQIGRGTGLGLAVSYGIVKMHRGEIRVSSNDDPGAGPTGTTFRVSIPREPARD